MTITKSLNYFEIYKLRKDDLLALGGEQLAVVNALGIDEAQDDGVKPGEVLQGIINRLETDSLRVLVIGRFNAGKSTYLNALFGKIILPSSPTPTTGVICEIRYADEGMKKATLFPKPGMGGQEDKPFDLDNIESIHQELCHYVKIDHSGDALATSRYQKLELRWPLPLCRDGVELIDSVGLDDPDARDVVTMEYAKSADAILYCMNSLQGYTARDKEALGRLRALGYENIFFIITYYDHLKECVERGETTEEAFRNDMARNLAQWSELKSEGIKYVDSCSALTGRMRGEPRLVQESGIEEIERALEWFLTQEKGRAKLQTSLRSLRSVNRLVRTVIPPRIGMWQTPNEVLERRYREAKPRLDTLEETRRLLVESATLTIREIARSARDCVQEYLLEIPAEINKWAADYEIEAGFGFPLSLKPLVTEVVDHMKAQIQQNSVEWSGKVLIPMIREKIDALSKSLDVREKAFFEAAEQIRIDISMGADVDSTEMLKTLEPSAKERGIAGGLGGIMGGPLALGVGAVFGMRAVLNTIVAEVVAIIGVGFFVSLSPIGVILVALAALGVAQIGNVIQIKGRIKTTTAEKLGESIQTHRRELAENIRLQVEKALLPLGTTLDEYLGGEIASVRGEVEKILEAQRKGKANAAQNIKELENLQRINFSIEEELEKLLYEAGIGV
jgi:GTPase SAR1 family protein